MKKVICALVVSVLCVAVALGCAWLSACEPKKESNFYSLTTVITITNEKDCEYDCVDFNGNEWRFVDTVETWCYGDFASLLMDDNGTPENIYDDVIISANYSGWLNGEWGYDNGKSIVKN